MNLKTICTVAVVIANFPLAFAQTRVPYQIVHHSSGLCVTRNSNYGQYPNAYDNADVLLASCKNENLYQKFYLFSANGLNQVVPQTVTNPSGRSALIKIAGASGLDQGQSYFDLFIYQRRTGFDGYAYEGDAKMHKTTILNADNSIDNGVYTSWYLERINPLTQYSNAYFKIRDGATSEPLRPWGCQGEIGRAIGHWKNCSDREQAWRLQPTTYSTNP